MIGAVLRFLGLLPPEGDDHPARCASASPAERRWARVAAEAEATLGRADALSAAIRDPGVSWEELLNISANVNPNRAKK